MIKNESSMDQYDFEEESLRPLGEDIKDAKFPDNCPECGASNPSNADTCANCETQFEPIDFISEKKSEEDEEDNLGLDDDYAGNDEAL